MQKAIQETNNLKEELRVLVVREEKANKDAINFKESCKKMEIKNNELMKTIMELK